MNKKQKTAVVAMSGGVDSSVTALLLQQKGYRVIGLTGKMIDSGDSIAQNAQRVADKLGIELHVFDACEKFKEKVIDYFVDAYKSGQTPNPCIMCNQYIKWGVLFDYAIEKLGADVFATGHYADIRLVDGVYKLYPAKDEHKDQLYFLYRLGQKQLSKTVFPLYEYDKEQVKRIAIDYDLPPKDSKESQDICFIQKPVTTKSFLTEKFGVRKGDFIDIQTGKKLGGHDGCYKFTIGQRRGIGIAAPYPLHVIDIDAQKNIVYVGREEDNYKKRVKLVDLNLVYPPHPSICDTFNTRYTGSQTSQSSVVPFVSHAGEKAVNSEFDAWVKIRYNMPHKKAKVKLFKDYAEIEFYEPVNSVTSGQSGVIYDLDDKHLVGGGVLRT